MTQYKIKLERILFPEFLRYLSSIFYKIQGPKRPSRQKRLVQQPVQFCKPILGSRKQSSCVADTTQKPYLWRGGKSPSSLPGVKRTRQREKSAVLPPPPPRHL